SAGIARQRLILDGAIRKVEREELGNPAAPIRALVRAAAMQPPEPTPTRDALSSHHALRHAIREAKSHDNAADSAAGTIERATVAMRAEADQYGEAPVDHPASLERVSHQTSRCLPSEICRIGKVALLSRLR